jgi:hypothetical protein
MPPSLARRVIGPRTPRRLGRALLSHFGYDLAVLIRTIQSDSTPAQQFVRGFCTWFHRTELARLKAPNKNHSISLLHHFPDRDLIILPSLAEADGEILDCFTAANRGGIEQPLEDGQLISTSSPASFSTTDGLHPYTPRKNRFAIVLRSELQAVFTPPHAFMTSNSRVACLYQRIRTSVVGMPVVI